MLIIFEINRVTSLHTQTYFRLSLGFYFRQNQVTAGNTSAFAGYRVTTATINIVNLNLQLLDI